MSFRTKREILVSSEARNLPLRSLAFARDDRPWACRLASWRLGGRISESTGNITPGKFAQAEETFTYSNARYAKEEIGLSPAKRQRRKGRALSFRTKREIFPRSLAFARDDRPWACRLASLRSFDQAQDMLSGRNVRIRESSTRSNDAYLGEVLCGLRWRSFR